MAPVTQSLCYTRSITTSSQIYSSCIQAAWEIIKKPFPKNFYKTTFIDTQLRSATIEKGREEDTQRSVCPAITLVPLEPTEDTYFGTKPRFLSNPTFLHHPMRRNYKTLFGNEEDQVYIQMITDRIRIPFEARVKFETYMQALDYSHTLRRFWGVNVPRQIHNYPLTCIVPREFVYSAAVVKELDPNIPEQLQALHEYMTNFSHNHIREQIRHANGRPSWFHDFRTKVLFQFDSPPSAPKPSRKGDSFEDAVVTFSFFLEFNYPAGYVFASLAGVEPDNLPDGWFYQDEKDKVYISGTVLSNPPAVIGIKSLVSYRGFITDPQGPVQKVDLKLVLDDIVYKVYEQNKLDNIDNSQFFDVNFYRGEEMFDDNQFTIDWDTLELTLNHPFTNYPYYITFYANLDELRKVIDKISQGKKL